MKRTPSDAVLIARAPRYNVDEMVAHSESPPVFTGPPPVFQPPHSKFSALGSVTTSESRYNSSGQGADAFDGGMKVFSFSGYVGTPHMATPRDGLASGYGSHAASVLHTGTEHHAAPHLENGVDAIMPAHYNECAKALTTGSHAILDRAGVAGGVSSSSSGGSSGSSSGVGTSATPSPSSSPPLPPSHAVGPRLSAEARTASQSHGSLLDIASSLFHRPPHRLHEQQPAAAQQHRDPVARLSVEQGSRLTSRGSEPNFMSSRYVGSAGAGKTSPLSLRYKQPMVSAQDLNALAPLDL